MGIQTLKCGTYDAIITFNEGNSGRLKVLSELGIKIGKNCLQTFRVLDLSRIKKAEKSVTEESKQARKRRRMSRMNLLDAEKKQEPDYEAGMF